MIACALFVLAASTAYANDGGGVYQRNRHHHRGGGYHGGGFYHQPFFGGGFVPPTIIGSWYARPYPYHFDYYRWRYSMPMQVPPMDCPCVETVPQAPSI